jgi:hypothetical protein
MQTTVLKRRVVKRDQRTRPSSFVSHPAHPPVFLSAGRAKLYKGVSADWARTERNTTFRRASQWGEAARKGHSFWFAKNVTMPWSSRGIRKMNKKTRKKKKAVKTVEKAV